MEDSTEQLGLAFSDAVGIAALDHLRRKFKEQRINIRSVTDLELAYIEGQREVIRYIEEKVKQWQTQPR